MAITDKNIKTEVVQQTAPQQVTGGSTTETKQVRKPIDMTQTATELKNNNSEIIQYLNSEEFKKLSPEEQLKAFKNKYGLGLSDAEADKLFKGSKKIAAEFNQRTNLENGTGSTQAASTQTQTSANSEISAKKDIVQNLKSQGIENPTEGDLYNYLTTQQKEGKELTPEQTKLLKTYNQLIDNGFQGLKPTETDAPEKATQTSEESQAQTQGETLVPLATAMNKSFQMKSTKEKLNTYMDAYLAKNDAEYANMSEEDKKAYCTEKMTKYAQTFGIQLDDKNISGSAMQRGLNNRATLGAIAVLEEANSKGEKIDFSDGTLISRMEEATSNQIKKGIKMILGNEEFQRKSADEKLLAFADMMIAGDEKYAKLSDEDKIKYFQKALAERVGSSNSALASIISSPHNAKEREDMVEVATSLFKDFAKSDKTLNEFTTELKNNPIYATDIILQGVNSENSLFNSAQLINEVAGKLQAEGKDFSYDAVKNKLIEEKKTGTWDETKEIVLNQLEGLDGIVDENLKTKIFNNSINKRQEMLTKNPPTEQITEDIAKYRNNKEKLKTELLTNVYIVGSNKNIDTDAYIEQTINELVKAGVYKNRAEVLKNMPELIQMGSVNYLAQNNAKGVVKMQAKQPNNPANRAITNMAINGGILSKDQRTEFGVTTINSGNKVLIATQNSVLTDRNLTTKENAVEFISSVGNSGKVKSQAMSSFVKDYITTTSAKNGAEDTMYAARELAKQNNPAVTEGLAAAYNSVDNSVKSQYKSVIDNAVSSGNYTAEQKANIQNAMATGNISGSASTNNAEKAQNTTSQTSAKAADTPTKTVQTPVANVQTQKHTQGGVPQVQSNRTEKAGNTVSTSTNATVTEASVKNSETNKAKALENAQNTKASIDQAVKKWEEEHNTKLSDKQVSELKETVGAEVAGELLANSESGKETDMIQKIVANSTSVADLYDKLVAAYGVKVQDKFVEILALNGSSEQISSFAQSTKNSDVIKNLYLKCDSVILKSQLLNMLAPSTISEMLNAGQIEDLSSINYKFLVNYLKAHPSMGNGEFNQYMQYLPFDERQRICQWRMKSNPSVSRTESNELLNKTDTDLQVQSVGEKISATRPDAPAKGSDAWKDEVTKLQSGIKVPPSQMYDSGITSLDEEYMDVGTGSSTKLRFGGRYDKLTQKGAVYWG